MSAMMFSEIFPGLYWISNLKSVIFGGSAAKAADAARTKRMKARKIFVIGWKDESKICAVVTRRIRKGKEDTQRSSRILRVTYSTLPT